MDVFGAVADPTRRHILDLLADSERTAGALGAAFPHISQPAVSRHLRLLRDVDLVSVRSQGAQRWYSLRPEALREIEAWLARYHPFWQDRLDALERHLAAHPEENPK